MRSALTLRICARQPCARHAALSRRRIGVEPREFSTPPQYVHPKSAGNFPGPRRSLPRRVRFVRLNGALYRLFQKSEKQVLAEGSGCHGGTEVTVENWCWQEPLFMPGCGRFPVMLTTVEHRLGLRPEQS